MFLSIIIPIYNGEKTIVRCLDSIWKQGLPANDYEVICVNDCSADATYDALKKVQTNHPNLHIFNHKENLRAGGSRNHGVREAKGKYILFTDADDYLHPESLLIVLNHLQKQDLDILMCDFARETPSTPNNNLIHKFPNQNILSGRDFLLINSCPFAPWKYIFKKSLMTDNHIFFEERVCCEDVDWTHHLALKAKKMQYQPILLVHNVINEQSQTANEHLHLRPISEKFFAGYRLARLAEQYDDAVAEKLNGVASIYYTQGIRYMPAVSAPLKEKKNTITRFLPSPNQIKEFSLAIRLVRSFPWTFSFVSNIAAPIIKSAISLKRKYAGR